MDHQEATQLMATEKYLLNELPPELREAFEEHFFGCVDCAADVRATDAFLSAARLELAPRLAEKPVRVAVKEKRPFFEFLWRPAFAVPVFAVLLLVIAYQNVVVYPHQKQEIAQLETPQVLPALSLAAGASRGGELPSITVGNAQPFLLGVDLPTQERFSSYTCVLYSPSGSIAFEIHVSAQQAKDTVSISVPARDSMAGVYTLKVLGNAENAPAVDLAPARFAVKAKD